MNTKNLLNIPAKGGIPASENSAKVKEPMLVKLADGNTYRIANVSANDDDYISYDLLTLERYTKGE